MRDLRRLEKSARRGNAQAQYHLAALLASGDQVPQDLEKAVYWYQKAAQKQCPEALYKLGFMYLLGEGVAKDTKRGLALIEEAAKNGSLDAQELYADILLNGRFHVERDWTRALYFYVRSFGEGNTRAAFSLSQVLMNECHIGSIDIAKALLQLAAESGVKEARDTLSNIG